MKGIDIFCASQAATSICSSMEQQYHPSSSSSSTSTVNLLQQAGSSSPAIDRHNPIITDSRRAPKPQIPTAPNTPRPHKTKKNKKNKENEAKKLSDHHHGKVKLTTDDGVSVVTSTTVKRSWGCTKPGEFISPPGSTRYLLSEKVLFTALSDRFDTALKVFPGAETSKSKDDDKDSDQAFDAKAVNSQQGCPNQVVVLRVSLHCRGCERKMRKHISRMQGVTSFNIDFAAKKVTVTGNITPLEVLSSISKVKNAQLWSPSITSSSMPPVNQSNSEVKNEFRGAGA